jgi:hypothetical protein
MSHFASGTDVPSNNPITFYVNEDASQEKFTGIYPTDQPGNRSLFPRTAVGDNQGTPAVYTVYTYTDADLPDSITGEIFFKRSLDGGETWESEVAVTGGANALLPGFEAFGLDRYAIEARDNFVAISFVDFNFRLLLLKSDDYGETWNASLVQQPNFRYNQDRDTTVDGEQLGVFASDTLDVPGLSIDMAIDSKGLVHVVYPQWRVTYETTGRVVDGALQPVDRLDIYFGSSYFNYGLIHYIEGAPNLIYFAPPAGTGVDGDQLQNATFPASAFGTGYVTYPDLSIDDNDNLYCVYTSPQNGDIDAETSELDGRPTLFSKVFVTHKNALGAWSTPINLTDETGQDCMYGTIANQVKDGHLWMAWQCDERAGIYINRRETSNIEETDNLVYAYAMPLSDLNPSPDVPHLCVQKRTMGFSDVDDETFSLTNVGNVDVVINQMVIVSEASGFTIDGETEFPEFTLTPGQTETFAVDYDRAGGNGGGSNLQIQSNAWVAVDGQTGVNNLSTYPIFAVQNIQGADGPQSITGVGLDFIFLDPTISNSETALNIGFCTPISSVEENYQDLLGSIENFEVFPNPATDHATIRFEAKDFVQYEMMIVDMQGNIVRNFNGSTAAGMKMIPWNGRDNSGADVANGVYRAVLRIGGNVGSMPITIVR